MEVLKPNGLSSKPEGRDEMQHRGEVLDSAAKT